MGNTLTGLLPTIYLALDTVARELVGFIPAVSRNSSAARVALGQTVAWPIAPAVATANIVPGSIPPDDGDQVIGAGTMTIQKSKYASARWTGEEQLGQKDTGTYPDLQRQQFEQAFRAVVNEVEADVAALYVTASRAVGAAGTTPFGTVNDFSDFANVSRILEENGAPESDRHLVLGSAARFNIRAKQALLFRANEAGTDALLRRGVIGLVEGLDVHGSAQIPASVTKGTANGAYLVNNVPGPYAIGSTVIAVDTGAGTVLAGDQVTFAGDSNVYVVASALAAGSLTLAAPGLRKTLADGVAMTIEAANFVPNMGFHRNAIQLLTRAPAMPEGGDAATDVIEITDPISGLAFQIARYGEYRRVRFEVGLAWGVKAVKPEFMALLLG